MVDNGKTRRWVPSNHEHVLRTFVGFYADVHLVRRARGEQVIVKVFRQRGIADREAAALTKLADITAGATEVPRVLAVNPASLGADDPSAPEVIEQTYIAGESAASCAVDAAMQPRLAEQIIDIVQHWHAHEGTMFEDRQGGRHTHFLGSYLADIEQLATWLRSAHDIAEQVRHRLRDTITDIPALLAPLRDDRPVFIHDDCHAGNFLVSAETGALIGVIDPGRARYSHRELDLFHLADAAPDLHLRERALARHPLAEGGEARRLLFSLWDDVAHARATGWRDDQWLARKLDDFNACRARTMPG